MRPSFPAFLYRSCLYTIYSICTDSWLFENGGWLEKLLVVRVDVGNTAIRAILTVIKFNCLIKREK